MARFALFLAIWAAFHLPAAAVEHIVFLTDGSRVHAPDLAYYRDCIRVTTVAGMTRDLEWGDVLSLGDRPSTLQFSDGETLKGLVVGLDGYDQVILVHDLLGRLTIPRRLLPATPPEASHAILVKNPTGEAAKGPKDSLEVAVNDALEEKPWNGRVALGASLSAGNSDTLTATLDALIQRDWRNDHVEFRGFATYGTSEGEVNRDSQLLSGLWRHFYEPHFYSYASIEMSRDEIQDRSFRGLFNVGAGYIAWQQSDLESFSIEGGLGYRVEVYSGVTATRHDATARLAALYKDLLFEDVRFTQSAEIIFPVTDVNSFIARSESLLSIPLNEAWDFRFGLRLEWNNDPAAGRDEMDVLATTGLEYKF